MKLHSLDYLLSGCVGEYHPARVVYNGLDITNPFEWANSSSLAFDFGGVVKGDAKIANIETTRWQMPKVGDAMDVNVKRVYDELYDVKRQVECLLTTVDVDVWTDVYSDTFCSIAMYMEVLHDRYSREVWYGEVKDLLLCWLLDFTALDGERFARLLHDKDAKRFMLAYEKLSNIFWGRGIRCGGVHLFFPAKQECMRHKEGKANMVDWSLDRESGYDYYKTQEARINRYGHTYKSYVRCLRYFYDVIESDEYRRTSVYRACVDNVISEYEYILLKYLSLDIYIRTPISVNDEERNEVERKIKERIEDFLLPLLEHAMRLRCDFKFPPHYPPFDFRGLFWVLRREFPQVWDSLQASVEVGETEADKNDETEHLIKTHLAWLDGEYEGARFITHDDYERLVGYVRELIATGKCPKNVEPIERLTRKVRNRDCQWGIEWVLRPIADLHDELFGGRREKDAEWGDLVGKLCYEGNLEEGKKRLREKPQNCKKYEEIKKNVKF